jgi:hypothetical protein
MTFVAFIVGVVVGILFILGIQAAKRSYDRWLWNQMDAAQKRDALAKALRDGGRVRRDGK